MRFKDSGIEWLGEIPEHWEVRKLKYIGEIVTGKTPEEKYPHYWGDDMLFITPLDCNDEKYISNTQRKISKSGILNFTTIILPKDSIVAACIASVGKVAMNRKSAITNQQINSVIPNKKCVSNSFIYYQLFSIMPQAKKCFCGFSTLPIINKTTFADLPIPLPPLEEQKAIAEFLDKKCDKISQFIESKQKLITLLQEKKQTLINAVVCRGLNKNTELKESGVKYLGTIPKHWEVRKLKYIVFSRNQRKDDKDFKIGLENIESKTGKYIPTNENVFEDSGISFYKNDILFGKLRPYLAKVFLADRDGICVSEFLVLESKEAYSNFLKFLMLSSSFIDIIDSSTYGTKMPRTSWEFVGNLKIPLPPLQEQKAIADYLDTQITKIDLAIEKTKQQITYIKEYKTSLINQAICGRIALKD